MVRCRAYRYRSASDSSGPGETSGMGRSIAPPYDKTPTWGRLARTSRPIDGPATQAPTYAAIEGLRLGDTYEFRGQEHTIDFLA